MQAVRKISRPTDWLTTVLNIGLPGTWFLDLQAFQESGPLRTRFRFLAVLPLIVLDGIDEQIQFPDDSFRWALLTIDRNTRTFCSCVNRSIELLCVLSLFFAKKFLVKRRVSYK